MHKVLITAAFGLTLVASAHTANIITFGNADQPCGGTSGAVMCSTNGTLGYSGTVPFDLSTISQWFQIDANGVNQLTGTQTVAERNGGAGDFRVLNDTGKAITQFSLTLVDTLGPGPPGAANGMGQPTNNGACGTSNGPCWNFQIQDGNLHDFPTLSLTGTDCVTSCGTASANFVPDMITYNWADLPGGGSSRWFRFTNI